MKQITAVLITVIITVVAMNTAIAQPINFGAKTGLNVANVGGDDVGFDAKSRTGIAFGGYLSYPIANAFYVQPEVLYSMKGTVEKGTFGGSSYTGTLKLNYLEIPILGKLVIPLESSTIEPMLFAGPSLAFKTSSKVHGKWAGETWTEDYEDVKGTDFGFVLGGGVMFPVSSYRVGAEIRYSLGLTSFDSSEDNFELKNNVLMLMVSFQIGTLHR